MGHGQKKVCTYFDTSTYCILTSYTLKIFLCTGCMAIWMRLPSSNLSMSSTSNDRQVCLLFGSEPMDFLFLENELKYLYGWNCTSGSKSHRHKDICPRICGTGVHVLAAVLLICVPWFDHQKIVRYVCIVPIIFLQTSNFLLNTN